MSLIWSSLCATTGRLVQILSRGSRDSSTNLVTEVFNDLVEFLGPAGLQDDVTVLAIAITDKDHLIRLSVRRANWSAATRGHRRVCHIACNA
jgi:hypothetical protein